MFSTPHFDDMEELYSAYRPITPSLSNSRPSNSEQMKYSTQPTDRIPLHDFRRDSLELYGLKPRHYPVEDSSSEQDELATDSSDAPSAPFQPKWKEWIMEKRQGIEELEKQLDNFKINGVENELEEFSDDNSLKYKVFNPPDEYKYTPFHDRNEEPVLSHENILTNMHQNMHRSRWTANRIRLNIDKVISREEKRTESEPVPGAFPREIVYLPIPVQSEDRRNSSANEFEDCESLGGPITYLSHSILVPLTVKLLSFVMYHLAALSQRKYTFSGTSAEALHLLVGLDKTMTGVGGLYAAQRCLDYMIDFPLACHTRYHLLKYGIEIVRDSGSEYLWNEYHKEFLKLHSRALEEFQKKLKRKLWFSFFILTMFSLIGTLFVGFIHVMTWSNGDVGSCFNNILFGRAQLAGLVFCLLGQTCYECMSYFKQFIGQYAEETMDLLMKKLEQCKALQEQKLNQMQLHYNQTENCKAERKPFKGNKKNDSNSDFTNTSSSEDKNDVLLISTPENSSSVVYRPQPYISPLKGRSEINSKSLHLVDPSSPPTAESRHSAPVSEFESTNSYQSRSPRNAQIAYGVTTTFQKEGSITYLIRAAMSLFKLPFKLTVLSGRFVLHLFPWRLYVSLTRD